MEQRRSLTRPPGACTQKSACRWTAWRTADAARRCDHLDSSAAATPPRGSLERVAAFSCFRGVLSNARSLWASGGSLAVRQTVCCAHSAY
eukprot:scaffold135784_cov178-Phaeocystis_antarctica.AAC.2